MQQEQGSKDKYERILTAKLQQWTPNCLTTIVTKACTKFVSCFMIRQACTLEQRNYLNDLLVPGQEMLLLKAIQQVLALFP